MPKQSAGAPAPSVSNENYPVPVWHRPPVHLIERAERDIPAMMEEELDWDRLGKFGGTLIHYLTDLGNRKNAAEWAVYSLIEKGLLRAEKNELLPPAGPGGFQIYPTSALWTWYANLPAPVDNSPAGAEGEPSAPQFVTLDQMAGHINRSKKTMERYKNRRSNPLPPPAVEGGGGKAAEWIWSEVRSWLEHEFGRALPEHIPSRRADGH
jgi:hypothetical protein